MSNVVPVVEKDVSLSYLVNSFEMNVIALELNTSVTVSANCLDRNSTFLFNKVFVIEGQEYTYWGNNDEYLKSVVASKLGLIPLSLPLISS